MQKSNKVVSVLLFQKKIASRQELLSVVVLIAVSGIAQSGGLEISSRVVPSIFRLPIFVTT